MEFKWFVDFIVKTFPMPSGDDDVVIYLCFS